MSEPMCPGKRSTLRRSKDGCLTCRKKRKKCDEKWPICSRCEQTRSCCIWPSPRPVPTWGIDLPIDAQAILDLPLGNDINNLATSEFLANDVSTHSATNSHTDGLRPPDAGISSNSRESLLPYSVNLGSNNTLPVGPPSVRSWMGHSIVSTNFRSASSLRMTKSLEARMWEYAHDLGPRIVWPPEGCMNCDELDPEGMAPKFRQSITAFTQITPIEPVFRDVFDFYATFLTRLFYDYTLTPDTTLRWILRKFNSSNSAKYGMLCMASMFRSDYDRSTLAPSWRDGAREAYFIALNHLSRDLEDPKLSPWEKLTGLIPIMDYEFHTGQISKYFAHVTLALPLVKGVIGSDTIDLLNLREEQTFDVSMWVWCDILDSMATSTPTRLKYESDLERIAQPGGGTAYQSRGIEWLYGIPNVLAVILARTSNLRHEKLSVQEKALKGAEIEQLIRRWQIRALETRDPRLRVERLGAQEIWRHTAILYVHHAIFKSGSEHPTVRDSVKNIVKIASTLKPGGNPDSFLYLPYFISAFYATSQRDRQLMRSRMLNSANALFLRNMARYLDELWKESDAVGQLTSWSAKKPPRIAF